MSDINIPRLLAAAEEFNIGISTLIHFLTSKGVNCDNFKPKTRLSEEIYNLLKDEFQNKKVAESKIENYGQPENTDPNKLRGPKILGKIELPTDNTSRKPQKEDRLRRRGATTPPYSKNLPSQLKFPIKLGRIKSLNAEKGYGFVFSFDDKKDCFFHVSKLITPDIHENDIVVLDTLASIKKPGELEAINVSNKIPVFVFTKETYLNSFVYPLLGSHLGGEMPLIERYEVGFAFLNARFYQAKWKTSLTSSDAIRKSQLIEFAKMLIDKLFLNVHRYDTAINWLVTFLHSELMSEAFDAIFEKALKNFEQRPLTQIDIELKNISGTQIIEALTKVRKQSLNKIGFVLWIQGKLERLPLASTQIEADIWSLEIVPALSWQDLQKVLIKLHSEQGASKQVEELYRHLVDQGFEIKSIEQIEIVASFLEPFRDTFPTIILQEINYNCKSNELYVELWRKGLIRDLSDERVKIYIEEFKSDEEKAAYIEKLPIDKILSYYHSFPSLSHYLERYIAGMLEDEFSKIDYVCFDIESDGERIREFAWKNGSVIKSDADFDKPEEGIAGLMSLINSGSLIIGQNIKEFDLPVLAKHGALPSFDRIWDTLEIEMLLNPGRFSYGLKTQHGAISDTELTYRLFRNQLSRIIVSRTNLSALSEVLPSKAVEIIDQISQNPNWKLLEYSFLLKQADEFYRPHPTNQDISEETLNKLKGKLEETGHKVVIAPEILWNTLSHQFDLAFYSDNRSFGFCLNKEKIEANLRDEKLLKAVLVQFVESWLLRGLQPFVEHLPVAIRLKLTSEQITLICDSIGADFGSVGTRPICIKPSEIGVLQNDRNQISGTKAIVIGSELYGLTSKLQLGQDLDFATIFDRLKNEPIWLQMSGGKSFISLEQSHCRKLGVTEFPEFIQNIWLERIGKGKFKLWCNQNFDAVINDLSFNEVSFIDWVGETITKVNSYIIRPDTRKSGYIAEQKRVNPESLYRKNYWTYQFKLFEGIEKSGNPKVLIVNDESEIDNLAAYARRRGFFVPDSRASLFRQIELLHSNKSSKTLLLAPIQTFEKIVLSNYAGPLDFIWDSFLLQEKYQMLKGKNLDDFNIAEDQNQEDHKTGTNPRHRDYDIFSLIKLHKPLIDYFYRMLYDNNHDSRLFLCDPRLTDYFGIEKSLQLNSKSVPMWVREADYAVEITVAAEFFPTLHENADTAFNINEAKEILRHIFLASDNGGEPHQWYDYQHPCLNEILSAKKDLLISLPTGAGKSILFQGPALFRSAFSCKLSIVVGPLRALMQDQVDALWNKGFYSNVEFLSGDKSHVEIKDIYRRISGGEITLLYITPERFRSRSFENCLLTRLDADSGLEYVVFDEAHCISQWGQEFRPDYLNAGRKVADYSGAYDMRKLLFSATISEQVFNEISNLIPGIVPVEGTEKNYNPVRDHIKMDFKHNVVEDERLLEISNYLKTGRFNPNLSRAIIFVKSRKKVDECALIMPDSIKEVFGADCDFADKVGAFHAGMDAEDRRDTYEKYKTGDLVILFATKAFGMGMDIPNIHFVTHYSPPGTFEDFLQEIGRAGRNEKLREEAGFNNNENPIKTLCLTANNDFAKLKDQLLESSISWHEVKEIKNVLEKYISGFTPLKANNEIPIAVPFNLYSSEKDTVDDLLDSKFRIALHWLEKLDRIKLGYFTITHLEFAAASLIGLKERIDQCPDEGCKKVCYAIIELLGHGTGGNAVVQLSIASLRNISKLNLESLFNALLKNHTAGILRLMQEVVIAPTKTRLDEANYCKEQYFEGDKYPALQVVFSLASKILDSVDLNSAEIFEGEELDEFLKVSINENIGFNILPWTNKDDEEAQLKECANYIKDIFKKRSKHAFTIIRILGKTRHETKMEKVVDGDRKVKIKQSVFNGYHKKEEWVSKIKQLKEDCIKLLDYVAHLYFEKNQKTFNWPDVISELDIKGNVQYLSDLLFILSVLGHVNTGSLLPTGIEAYLTSIEKINETDLQSLDKKVFDEFEDTRKVRELKLIALEVLAGFQKASVGDNASLRKKQDAFIRKYFGCNSLESLLQLLQDELPPNDPLLIKWRGDAIQTEEDRLNLEQRKVYDADINQHINVMAGPGSGKTHTLTLRVAKLVHHAGIKPEEILVLAYNRAVVSELKERLGKLFNELGYGNLAKRIKIFTFHGLVKRFCPNQVKDQPFDKWENILLNQLISIPGQILNYLAPLKHILVDEFQDINNIRIKLLNKLHELTNSHLFIIGDPNQSIYGYDRLKEGGRMSPWPYYENFNQLFSPSPFELYDNHRSYPDILGLANQVLILPAEHQHLVSRPTRNPDKDFISNYAQVIDLNHETIDWCNQVPGLLQEKIGQRPYKQIAILFRTNNEVYKGFQKVKALNLTNIRIRIQGSLPYEFTRIRECYAVILFLKSKLGQMIPSDFRQTLLHFINNLISQNQNWSHFYIKVIHAVVLEFLEEQDERQIFDSLLDYIDELTYKDDGQLYKIYEKHLGKVSTSTNETEIVLTTMHKVKGLEFDCVIVPPSFTNLPLRIEDNMTEDQTLEQLDEERRLAYVAYSRARYRLLIFKHNREIALENNNRYAVPENENARLGIPIQPELKRLYIGWAAKSYNYNSGINDFMKSNIKSGDLVFVKSRHVPNNGNPFTVHELFKEGAHRAIGQLSRDAGSILRYHKCTGLVVNEVVVWSYEDTLEFDAEHGTDYAPNWCEGAKNHGYIYLVDFAGYAVPTE